MPSSGASLGDECFTALAFCPVHQRLYAFDGLNDELVTVNQANGTQIRLGSIGYPVITGMAVNRRGVLYAIDGSGDQLLHIDPKTRRSTAIGQLGFSSVQSLAFDSNDRLFGVDTVTDQLVEINLSSGRADAVGIVSAPSVFGLACGLDGQLYAVSVASLELYSIDPSNASTTLVGRIQEKIDSMHGMTTNAHGRLVAYGANRDRLYELDSKTAKPLHIASIERNIIRNLVARALPKRWPAQIIFSMSFLAATLAVGLRKTEVGSGPLCFRRGQPQATNLESFAT